jgi:predicted GTPase
LQRRVIIMGAAGRDFHNFNSAFRGDPATTVVAFTATQIPYIDDRTYPAALAGPAYPEGIPIVPEERLEDLITGEDVDEVVFSYSDVRHVDVMHVASRVLAAGADFRLLGPRRTELVAAVPVVAVCAVRTGSGKSQTTRRVAEILRAAGRKVVAVRHPMPYGDLASQAMQRFTSVDDLVAARATIEEREEYEPHLAAGTVVYAGVDYHAILERAQAEADVLVWDGGNNDLPFYRPDLHIVVADPLRAGHESSYHPGEANARAADVLVINKVDEATPEQVAALEEQLKQLNADAVVVKAASPVRVEDPELVTGKRVLVIEDGPTLTHGEMSYGAGVVAARRLGAAEIVDPRPFLVGSLAEVYDRYPHIGALVPAMGYSDEQVRELETVINQAPVDAVVIGTPIDLRGIADIAHPATRVRYDLVEQGQPDLATVLDPIIRAGAHPAPTRRPRRHQGAAPMTTDAQTGDYRSFLEAQPVPVLRDWALELAKDRHDVGFYWDVAKHLPSTAEVNLDWATYDPIDAIRELGHLFRHFREEAADPEVADLLRIRYVEYLVEHADDRRFDRRTGSSHPTTG